MNALCFLTGGFEFVTVRSTKPFLVAVASAFDPDALVVAENPSNIRREINCTLEQLAFAFFKLKKRIWDPLGTGRVVGHRDFEGLKVVLFDLQEMLSCGAMEVWDYYTIKK